MIKIFQKTLTFNQDNDIKYICSIMICEKNTKSIEIFERKSILLKDLNFMITNI